MFTGLIEGIGEVAELERGDNGAKLRVATGLGAELDAGDSVAVNGVCLTAASADAEGFEAEAMNQTVKMTSLGSLNKGDKVNLELALGASDRLGGHILQGHVDGTAEVTVAEDDGFARRLRLRVDSEQLRYVVERGSVGLDGVSLTVSALGDDWLEVSLIPETLERTTLGELQPGAVVNVECDLIARYVEKLV